MTLFGSVPADLDTAIFLVIHTPSDAVSVLRGASPAGRLSARHAADEQVIRSARV